MKKIISLVSVVGIIILLLGISLMSLNPKKNTNNKTLTIYNWGDYLDPSLIKKFEKETGYHVQYETFDSNEAMYTKIKQGGTSYDIAIPSDYMIQKMKKQHLLKPLDHSKIKGMDNLASYTLNQQFDYGNKYSIPYFFGTLGIVYNEKLLPKGVKIEHWRDLWNPKLKNNVMLFDGAREIISISLLKNGYDLNSTNTKELEKAKKDLNTLAPNVKALVADEMKMYLTNEEAAVGVTFSGEAMTMMANNPNLRYIVPSEGSNLWFDNIVIPKTAKNIKGAYAFINFMLDPINAKKNAEYIGYATPNKKAQDDLPDDIRNNPAIYPKEDQFNYLKVYKLLSKKDLDNYYKLFLNFKMLNK